MDLVGSCPCGAVRFRVHGEALAQFYCHCKSCRRAHASPIAALALFPVDAVEIEGQTDSVSMTGPDGATRMGCAACGSRVANVPSGEKGPTMRAIFPDLCESADWFQPTMHTNWESHALELEDDLPKFVDVPKEWGGSGQTA